MNAERGAQPGAGGLTARALGLLAALGPERAHGLALAALRTGLVPLPGPITTPRLATEMAGLALPNPLGLAAGFDKNAEALAPLGRAGFGFVEIGAVTPRAQPGNPPPRLFRLAEDRAAINRFGFNNEGMEAAAARLARRRPGPIVGLNLGANRDSSDLAGDYCAVLTCCGPHVDFATVNVSSPNTAALRNFDDRAALESLLARVMAAQAGLARPIPIFLKITPDLELDEIAATAELAVAAGVHGIIATNTTRSREGLKSGHAPEAGGLSGAPLFARSTQVLAHLARASAGRLVLIGVGGVENAETAYAKIRAGASAVQLYTALAYGGMGLVREILTGLDAALARDGFASVAEAVGTGTQAYL